MTTKFCVWVGKQKQNSYSNRPIDDTPNEDGVGREGGMHSWKHIPLLFALNSFYGCCREVVELTITLLPIMGLYIIFDGITVSTFVQCALYKIVAFSFYNWFFLFLKAVSTGILRGCGRQYIGAGVVFFSYIFMALPVGISLMFLSSLRLSGKFHPVLTLQRLGRLITLHKSSLGTNLIKKYLYKCRRVKRKPSYEGCVSMCTCLKSGVQKNF